MREELFASVEGEARPREQHYIFAHRLLPDMAFREAELLLTTLSGPHKRMFLKDAWDRAADIDSLGEMIGDEGLDAVVEGHLAIIRLPQPECVAEAHFAALLYTPEKNYFLFRKPSSFRYFTLEHTVREGEGATETVLGEWCRTAAGEWVHLDHGPGPEPSLAAFREVVLEHGK